MPLDARLFSDQLTPVTAYRTLVAADDREAPSFLFESVVNGTQTVRRAWRLPLPRRSASMHVITSPGSAC